MLQGAAVSRGDVATAIAAISARMLTCIGMDTLVYTLLYARRKKTK